MVYGLHNHLSIISHTSKKIKQNVSNAEAISALSHEIHYCLYCRAITNNIRGATSSQHPISMKYDCIITDNIGSLKLYQVLSDMTWHAVLNVTRHTCIQVRNYAIQMDQLGIITINTGSSKGK